MSMQADQMLSQTVPAGAADAVPDRGRLLVAAHFVYAGRVGGAEHMLYNLLRGMAGSGPDLTVLCSARANLDAGFLHEIEGRPDTRVLERGGGGPRFLAEQRACADGALSADAVLFPNYYVPPWVPARLGRVVTVLHDLQYKHFPQNFSARKRAWLAAAQAFAVRRADRLVVISDFVGQDVRRWFGDGLARKLVVIPNPISWDRFEGAGEETAPLAQPYILSVAAQYPHKNLEVLVRGFAALAHRHLDLQLVLCGQGFGSLHGVAKANGAKPGGLLPVIQALGLENRVRLTGYVDDAALGRWYRHASLFAFPSVFEGFGMPAVEALGFGLPTLTTRCTALPETTLGLAQYVDRPDDAGEWAERMDAIIRDPAGHRPDVGGIERLRAHYSPRRIGAAYRDVCLG
jgi:glycosyltransferase involved in cell wall biosynthesis